MRILKGEVRHVLVGFGQLEHLQARLRQHHILCLRARFLGTVEEPRNMENGSSGSLIHFGRQTFESVLWFHIEQAKQSPQRPAYRMRSKGSSQLAGKASRIESTAETVRPTRAPGQCSALTMISVY